MFEQYPDMNQDGKKDAFDAALFHGMISESSADEPKQEQFSNNSSSSRKGSAEKIGTFLFLVLCYFIYVLVKTLIE